VIDCRVVPSLGVDPITASTHQWRGGSRGASLGGPRLVVVSWKPSAWATTGAGCAVIKEDRDHNGTVEWERLVRQLQHLRCAVPDEGPPGVDQQLEEGAHPIRLLRELRPAGLLTAGRGAP
jgi:hypothetical protein